MFRRDLQAVKRPIRQDYSSQLPLRLPLPQTKSSIHAHDPRAFRGKIKYLVVINTTQRFQQTRCHSDNKTIKKKPETSRDFTLPEVTERWKRELSEVLTRWVLPILSCFRLPNGVLSIYYSYVSDFNFDLILSTASVQYIFAFNNHVLMLNWLHTN